MLEFFPIYLTVQTHDFKKYLHIWWLLSISINIIAVIAICVCMSFPFIYHLIKWPLFYNF